MNEQYIDEVRDILKRMRAARPAGPVALRCIEELEQMSWARDLVALRLLWPSYPALVEEDLDAMTSLLHEFPETSGTRTARRRPRLPRRTRQSGRTR